MDLLITGASGFLGSQLAFNWLTRYPEAQAICLIRAVDEAAATERLCVALSRAASDNGVDVASILARVRAVPGDMDDSTWIERTQPALRGPFELIHCAANLSFREADRGAVWRTNVDGTEALLHALPNLPSIAAFNHVSTAYVAGDRDGTILECEESRPAHFNNPYEESKWTAETLVRKHCAASGTPWRILRPSIIVAHSVSHRMSSHSGFYQAVDTLRQLGRKARRTGTQPVLRLPVAEGTTLDLIPVDVVVTDILELIAAGCSTANRTFHVTGVDPLRLTDVLRELSPMSGMSIEANDVSTQLTPLASMVMHRLQYYMPYFGIHRRFDQTNLRASLGAHSYRIDIDKLRGFVHSYMEQGSPAAC